MNEQEQITKDLRMAFAKRLSKLCADQIDLAISGGLPSPIPIAFVAGECLRMSAHLAAFCSTMTLDEFTDEGREIFVAARKAKLEAMS